MSQENRSRAQKLVEAFKGELSDGVIADIGNHGFEKLILMVNEAIQEDRKMTADQLEEVLKTLRKDIDVAELGM